MSKRPRDEPPDAPPPVTESAVGITAYRSAAQALHPTGIFQLRWADFHVRELSGPDGAPLALTALPAAAPPAADVISFAMYKENRTTTDALQQLATASGVPASLE